MEIELALQCNKSEVLDMIQCYESSDHYQTYSELFDDIFQQTQMHFKPKGYYVAKSDFHPWTENPPNIEHIDEIICCLVTLDVEVVKIMDRFFAEGDYMGGILFNAMADAIIFKGSLELYEHIKQYAGEKSFRLSKRQEPGTGLAKIQDQSWILAAIQQIHPIPVTLTSGYMLDPKKSTGYFYLAGKKLPINQIDHDCSLCDFEHCAFRKVYLTVETMGATKVIPVPRKANLLDVIRQHHFDLIADCGGNKTCGKCKVKILAGEYTLSEAEQHFLSQEEQRQGYVLACFQEIKQDITIQFSTYNQIKADNHIVTDFSLPPITKLRWQLTSIPLVHKNPRDNQSLTDLIINQWEREASVSLPWQFSLDALQKLAQIKAQEHLGESSPVEYPEGKMDTQMKALTENQCRVVGVEKQSSWDSLSVLGVGVDVGTTTIVATLVDLLEAKVIGTAKAVNPQKAYGGDVISRIQYSIDHSQHRLGQLARQEVARLVEELLDKASADLKKPLNLHQIQEIAIAGNTTMMYFLADISPASLANSPFLTTTLESIEMKANYFWRELKNFSDLDWQGAVRLLPSLSAYVGADVLCGMYGTNMSEVADRVLLVDIGTNGEMVIKNKDQWITVATAAGPAFEGANIRCGMGSLKGAISKVKVIAEENRKDSPFEVETIGGGTPLGICGSGLIDLMAGALELGIVDETGYSEEIIVWEDPKQLQPTVVLTPKDIRELQLAKAAIRAGIEILLQEAHCSLEDLDVIFLAGGFGNHLNVKNAITIGLLPAGIENKTKVVGNSALAGSVRFLLEQNSLAAIEELRKKSSYIELSTHPDFNDAYIDYMMFEPVE